MEQRTHGQASESEWATFARNVRRLLEAQPARVDVDGLTRACEALGVPLAQLLSPDFDVDELPWIRNLE